MKVRRMTIGTVAAISVIGLTACGGGSGTANGDGFKIGIQYDQPGLGLKDGATYTGLDIDMARYVAKALGHAEKDITWVQASSAERETLISSGQVDLVVATYSITEQRRQQVDFAGPYFVAHQDLLVRRNDEEITGPDTLNGKTLCSVTGTTSAQLVKERYKGRITLQELPEYSDCVVKLADGEVDAVTTDDLILAGYAAQKRYRGVLRLVGQVRPFVRIGLHVVQLLGAVRIANVPPLLGANRVVAGSVRRHGGSLALRSCIA